jgi:sugar lactone lactonase YvrE
MRISACLALSLAFAVAVASIAHGAAGNHADRGRAAGAVTFSTLVTTPLGIEGLTGDHTGNLYTTGRAGVNGLPCPVWQVSLEHPALTVVGFLPAPSATTQCSPSGLTFDAGGSLYFADGDRVLTLRPDAATQPTATVFASGVPGTNGLAFDREGNLWTGDGTTGLGRVWRISPAGVVSEMFRIQPMRNGAALGGTVTAPADGVGRQARDFPTGALANTLGAQDLVANGLAFDDDGDLFVADTARGAIWKASFGHDGSLENRTGCDTTFTANTLCLDSIEVQHPQLEGIDGIALDRAGNIWADANERNAVIVVRGRKVVEVFRNGPAVATQLRNAGPLEFPTSPFLLGHRFCTSNSDGNRRDNSPNTDGELGGPGQPKGKISCMDNRLEVPGLPLPVQR